MTSADLVGVMRGALDLTTDYARARRQYGAPIGSFQAVQHLLADAFVAMEGSRSIVLHAAWAVDALPAPDALAAASAAKAYCARAARTVCETAVQVHGGIGNTWDCLAHVFLRRALLSSDVLGGIGPNLDAGARRPQHRSGRWTSLIPPRSSSSACGCAPGSARTTPACRPRRRPTSTGPGRPPGTRRSTTPASSGCPGRPRSAGTTCPACTR